MAAFIQQAPLLRPNRAFHHICPRMQSENSAANTTTDPSTSTIRSTPEKPASTKDICEGCGREGGPAPGCNGDGRIIGGLGAVVDWWPIKAYRPCPDFLKTKKTYRRAGQSLEEIAFGRKAVGDDLSIRERLGGK